jgi:hypothetical protein
LKDAASSGDLIDVMNKRNGSANRPASMAPGGDLPPVCLLPVRWPSAANLLQTRDGNGALLSMRIPVTKQNRGRLRNICAAEQQAWDHKQQGKAGDAAQQITASQII